MVVGTIIPFAGQIIPEAFLLCDGRAVSRDTYSALFDVIGTTYGSGDGSTTFNLPDLRNNVAMCSNSTYPIGSSGGESEHLLLASELAPHTHTIGSHGHSNNITATAPKLTHSVTQPTANYTALNATGSAYGNGYSRAAYYNRTSAAMTRATNLSVAAHTASACTMSGGVTNCPAFDTESTGSGAAHDNMMPYLALTYLIRYEPDEPPEAKMYLYNGCLPVGPSGCYIVGKG